MELPKLLLGVHNMIRSMRIICSSSTHMHPCVKPALRVCASCCRHKYVHVTCTVYPPSPLSFNEAGVHVPGWRGCVVAAPSRGYEVIPRSLAMPGDAMVKKKLFALTISCFESFCLISSPAACTATRSTHRFYPQRGCTRARTHRSGATP